MADTLRGSLNCVARWVSLVVLKGEAKQFKHLNERLHISSSTLTKRIGEAKGPRIDYPGEIDDRETSVNNLYRITERGQYVVAKMERLILSTRIERCSVLHKAA